MSGSERVILHVDMDAFFAAVEELHDPTLRGRPLAVAGPGHRTIITTSSYPARARGVRTGMTLGMARRLCPDLVVVRTDYAKYSAMSRRILEILETFTDLVEPFSVDEAFMDGTCLAERVGSAVSLGRSIKDRILSDTGLTCSVGIAPNKLLAKLASGLEKPDGLTVILPTEVARVLEKMPVQELCGVGPRTAEALRGMGIGTCGELGRYPERTLAARFGAHGPSLGRMGRGEDDSPVRPLSGADDRSKSVGHSATLPRDIHDPDEIRRVVHTLSQMVGRRARRHRCAGRRVTVTARFPDFSHVSRQMTLPAPISRTEEIYRAASRILDQMALKRPVRLLGVSLGQLEFSACQQSLLETDSRLDRLQEAMDRINDRFGEASLGYADLVSDLRGHGIISPAWRQRGMRETGGGGQDSAHGAGRMESEVGNGEDSRLPSARSDAASSKGTQRRNNVP